MKIIRGKTFTATRPWDALDIACMNGITTRLHWTDQPYKWHPNEWEEVFAVLDGRVECVIAKAARNTRSFLKPATFSARLRALSALRTRSARRVSLVVESEGSI
jgi:hypothetical protein